MWENIIYNIMFNFQDGNLVKINVGAAKHNLPKEKKRKEKKTMWAWS